LSRLERASLSPQGTRRSSDSGSSIGAWMAQMCVGQPCTPTNVVWKGGLVRNLPDRDQQRGCANRSIMRPTTADSLGRAKRHVAHTLQAPSPLFDDSGRPSCLRFPKRRGGRHHGGLTPRKVPVSLAVRSEEFGPSATSGDLHSYAAVRGQAQSRLVQAPDLMSTRPSSPSG